jgi:hypothetical protein
MTRPRSVDHPAVYVITTVGGRPWWCRLWRWAVAVARGVVAVLVLLLGAVDAWVTAVLGVPRVSWLVREMAGEYRRGRDGRAGCGAASEGAVR